MSTLESSDLLLADPVAPGHWATSIRQSVQHGFNCGPGPEFGCTVTLSGMLLELVCVALTFAASCWGGWLFSQYYFTRLSSQVRLACTHELMRYEQFLG
jgi:hypothetical protein